MEINQEYEVVPIRKLKPHPMNPNKGNVGVISESIEENGFFGAVIAQRSTNHILAGNHRWAGAKEKGLKKIPVIWLDVDDDQALRVMLVDNRSAALSQTDTDLLTAVLNNLPNPIGTGYTDDEYKLLVGVVESSAVDLDNVAPLHRQHHEVGPAPTKEPEADPILDAPTDIGGAFALKLTMDFEKVGLYQIPQLRRDMLMGVDDVPKNLKAWAGSATKNWPDDDQWWLYNFGVDSTSGMKDVSKCIMSFFTFDNYFECWWDRPDFWTSKMLTSKIKFSIMPEYSLEFLDARAMHIWQFYRSMWMGRYFQEAGIKVMPCIYWPRDDMWFVDNVLIPNMPERPETAALEFSSFDKTMGVDEKDLLGEITTHAVNSVKPDMLLFYAMEGGRDFIQTLDLDTEVFYVESRMVALRNQHKERKTQKKAEGGL